MQNKIETSRSITSSIFTAFLVSVLVFLSIRIIPGDPITLLLGENASNVQIERMNKELGLSKPILTQLVTYYKKILTLDFGTSIVKKKEVTTIIHERLPYTLSLAFLSSLISCLLGISIGTISAYQKYLGKSLLSHFLLFLNTFFISIPNFWIAPLLVLFFSLHWPYLPVTANTSIRSIFLPVITLSLSQTATLIQITQTSMEKVLDKEYLKTARAKGATELQVLFKHALPNAFIPVLMQASLQFGNLLTGAIVTENVFNWPGIGSLMYEAISGRDYPIIQACALYIAIIYISINTLTFKIKNKLIPERITL